MRLEKRVRKVESSLLASPIILHFPDGSTHELRGPRNFLIGLFLASYRSAKRTSLQAEQLELIRKADHADEPGGGHLVELVKVMLAAAEAPYCPELHACEPLDVTSEDSPAS
jgi:hypothetical protein